MKNNIQKDVVIVGAGPAGLSFARSLADTNLNLALIEKQPEKALVAPGYDGREIALTHYSKNLLEKLGVWQKIPANEISPIKEAKVLDGHSPYVLHFDHRKVCDDALGYLVSNHLIRKALYEEVKALPNVEFFSDLSVANISTNEKNISVTLCNDKKIESSLVVAADSRFSETRRNIGISASMNDFGRVAIVCRMKHEKHHHETAYECFNYGITLAILPLVNNQSSIVITLPSDKASEMLEMRDDEFNRNIENELKHKLGKMELLGARHSYPLISVYANRFISDRFALIGDAAVGMHPVTAHGFNLGLRGQNTLACEIKKALVKGCDIGSSAILEKYQSEHRKKTRNLYLATNAIVKLYTDESFFSKIARKVVLRIGNNFLPAKRKIMQQLTEVHG